MSETKQEFRFSLANLLLMMAPVAVVATICGLPTQAAGSPQYFMMMGIKVFSVTLGLPTALGALLEGVPGMLRTFLGMLGLYTVIAAFLIVVVCGVFLLGVIVGVLTGWN